MAATISSSAAPCLLGLFEKTIIASNCASGATPFIASFLATSSSLPLAATIPATCIPCISTFGCVSIIFSFSSAKLYPYGIFSVKYFPGPSFKFSFLSLAFDESVIFISL